MSYPPVTRRGLGQYREFIAAVRFLSIIPVPGSAQLFDKDDASERVFFGGAYFPLVGLVLALLIASIPFFLGSFIPPLALSAFIVVLLVLLTGGLHLDGLMDSCDGVFGGASQERKLEIMRDSRVGSFGVLGGICTLLLKFAILASLEVRLLPVALLIVLPLSRFLVIVAVRLFPSARPNGLGALFRQSISPRQLILTGICSLVIAIVVGQFVGAILWWIGIAFAFIFGGFVTRQLGGLTGDIYGALIELSEVILLCAFLFARVLL